MIELTIFGIVLWACCKYGDHAHQKGRDRHQKQIEDARDHIASFQKKVCRLWGCGKENPSFPSPHDPGELLCAECFTEERLK